MRIRHKVGKYDRYIVRGILHGYYRLGKILKYVNKYLEKPISVQALDVTLRILVNKEVLYRERMENKKIYLYKLYHAHYILPPSSSSEGEGYISPKTPFFVITEKDKNYDEPKEEFILKHQFFNKIMKKFGEENYEKLRFWIEKEVNPYIDKIMKGSKVDFIQDGKLISPENLMMDKIEEVIGRRDYYLLYSCKMIEDDVKGITATTFYLLDKLSKILTQLPMNKSKFDAMIKELEERENSSVKYEYKVDFPTEDELKQILEKLSDIFDNIADNEREISSRNLRLILI